MFANMAYNPSSLAHIRRQVNSLQVCIKFMPDFLFYKLHIFHVLIIIFRKFAECLNSHRDVLANNVEMLLGSRVAYAKWSNEVNVWTRKIRFEQKQL